MDTTNPIFLMVAGAALGAIFSSVTKIIEVCNYTYKFFFKKSYLEGDWFSYHWTYVNHTPKLIFSKVKIRKGILHRYTLSLQQNETGLTYKGNVVTEADQLIFKIFGTEHIENTTCRFPDIIPTTNEICGLWLSFDHDKKIAGGGILLSKTKLKEAQIEAAIKKNLKNEKDAILMHVQSRQIKQRKNKRTQGLS